MFRVEINKELLESIQEDKNIYGSLLNRVQDELFENYKTHLIQKLFCNITENDIKIIANYSGRIMFDSIILNSSMFMKKGVE